MTPLPAAQPHRRGDYILAVDDDPAIVDLYQAVLLEDGYTVRTALSGAEAIVSARAHHPDLILLDVMMPGIDGIAVCQSLRQSQRTKGIPIIFVTALAEHADRVRGLEAGGDDYLAKPFDIAELSARIVAVLRRSRKVVPPFP